MSQAAASVTAGHSPKPDWIAVDWGTSNVRAWAMDAGDAVLSEAQSDRGMGKLGGAAEYEAALLELVAEWLPAARATRVVICGMAGARQGWVEAPYDSVPCPPLDPRRAAKPATVDPRLDVTILHGLSQAEPPDVMRGEETQLAGLLALRPEPAVVCHPGTHCKWVELEPGRITRFATVMTGELFALLSKQSVLRHSMTGDGGEGWDATAFAEALSAALAEPATVATRLFSVRAESLLGGLSAGAARARLSGLLLGLELAATRSWWQGRKVVVIGADRLAATYRDALTLQGVGIELLDAEELTLAGLAAAHKALRAAA